MSRLVIRDKTVSENLKALLRANNFWPEIDNSKKLKKQFLDEQNGVNWPPIMTEVSEDDPNFETSVKICPVLNLPYICRGIFSDVYIVNFKQRISAYAHILLMNHVLEIGLFRRHICAICGQKEIAYDISDSSYICEICKSIEFVTNKKGPESGWKFHRLQHEAENSIYYGVELEIVHKEGKNKVLEILIAAKVATLSRFNKFPQLVYCVDTSLYGYGYELNFAPMTRQWYEENKDMFIFFFNELSKAGIRAAIDGKEYAGIHIHRSNKDIDESLIVKENHEFNSFNVLWYNRWFDFIRAWSGKSASHFRYYSSGGYKLLSSCHGGNNGATIEYRGYSSDILLDKSIDPDCCSALGSAIDWVEACCQMMIAPHLLDMHPMEAVEYVQSTGIIGEELLRDLKAHSMSQFGADTTKTYSCAISTYREYEISLLSDEVKRFNHALSSAKYFVSIDGSERYIIDRYGSSCRLTDEGLEPIAMPQTHIAKTHIANKFFEIIFHRPSILINRPANP